MKSLQKFQEEIEGISTEFYRRTQKISEGILAKILVWEFRGRILYKIHEELPTRMCHRINLEELLKQIL